MKNIQKGLLALLIASSVAIYSCKPNGDKGAEDTSNSNGEGAVDSTRLTNFDSTAATVADSTTIK